MCGTPCAVRRITTLNGPDPVWMPFAAACALGARAWPPPATTATNTVIAAASASAARPHFMAATLSELRLSGVAQSGRRRVPESAMETALPLRQPPARGGERVGGAQGLDRELRRDRQVRRPGGQGRRQPARPSLLRGDPA